jgi:IS605 OrfB family transposase
MKKKDEPVVTRIAYSYKSNIGKVTALAEQASRLGIVRSRVWQDYGTMVGVWMSDRDIRDSWMKDGTAKTFGTLANPWKETVRDAKDDIEANQTAAKVKVRRCISRQSISEAEKKKLYRALSDGGWTAVPYLRRLMRKYCPRGKNHTHNQIVVRSDNYDTKLEHGRIWLAVPSLVKKQLIWIPLNTTVAPTGTLRLILRHGRIEVHYSILAASIKSSKRPHGNRPIGIDKGYTEVLADSDGEMHSEGFGEMLTAESDRRKVKGQRRNKIYAVAKKAEARGDRKKAERIRRHNLRIAKRERRNLLFQAAVRTIIYTAVHAVVDKASVVVSEDLTWKGSKNLGRTWNRRLNQWQKGVIATAVEDICLRRGPAHALVNSAYTSQVDPRNGTFVLRRVGDRLYCFDGVVLQVDEAAAQNTLARLYDPDIHRYMPRSQVRAIIAERTRQHRLRLPNLDSSS